VILTGEADLGQQVGLGVILFPTGQDTLWDVPSLCHVFTPFVAPLLMNTQYWRGVTTTGGREQLALVIPLD
jgi:hypothetical protein